MADNLTLNAGSGGATLATDDIGGTHYQIVKISFGALDTATPASSANPLPVVQTGTLNVGTVTTVTTVAAVTAISNALPAGANAIGKLAANSGVDIGDVDVTSVPADPFGANADAASATGSISAKLRFIAGTGIPITGTVAVTQSGAWSLSANQSTNVAQLAGTTTDTNSGNKSAGTLRVVLATDQPALTNKLLVTPDSVALPANQSVNVAQVNGVTTLMGNGVTGTGSQRVTIASDNTAFSVNATDTGPAAHDAAISGNPVRIAGRALTADYTAVAAGDTADLITTLLGKLVTIPYANPANTWNYAAASGGIVNTTGVTAKAAGAAGVRNYVTHVDVVNGHATVDTDVQIRDGASGTVLWRGFAKAAGGGVSADFNPPLRGTAATLVEIACGTTGTATYFNLTGFTAAE